MKTVTEERAAVTKSDHKSVEAARQMYKEMAFDSDGNLVTDKVYQMGQEFDIRTYSVIDGERDDKGNPVEMMNVLPEGYNQSTK